MQRADLHAHNLASAHDAPIGSHSPKTSLGTHVIEANIDAAQPTFKVIHVATGTYLFFVCIGVNVTVPDKTHKHLSKSYLSLNRFSFRSPSGTSTL